MQYETDMQYACTENIIVLCTATSAQNGTNKGVLNPQSNHCLAVKQKVVLGVFAQLCFLLQFVWSVSFREKKQELRWQLN